MTLSSVSFAQTERAVEDNQIKRKLVGNTVPEVRGGSIIVCVFSRESVLICLVGIVFLIDLCNLYLILFNLKAQPQIIHT